MTTPLKSRLANLVRDLAKADLDAVLVAHPPDWFYLTGFTGESGVLLVEHGGATLISDGRFMTQARSETRAVRIIEQKGALMEFVGAFLRGKSKRVIGFDPMRLTVAQLLQLKKASGRSVRWNAAPGLVSGLRMHKDESEIACMRQAATLAGDVLTNAVGLLKPGITEREVGAEIEYQMRKGGASGPAFETIVAFGERAALPHARPTGKRLRKNELVVLDLGAILAHYCSDITRTVYVGKAPARVKKWYGAVLEAQTAAIASVRDGVACGDVDAAARQVLARHKLDSYFTHSTGHGLGLEVHEDPRLARGQRARLKPGVVVTIEPGVYMPGSGGIRIEDDVVVHPGKTEVLTRVRRDLIEL